MGFFTNTEETLSEHNLQSENNNNEIKKMYSSDTQYELYYEDIMDVMENPNSTVLRNLLISLVHMYKLVIIKGLNSYQRNKIYNQCYYPLTFEKIIKKENVEEIETKNKEEYTYTHILIYNYKIKQNNENEYEYENENEFIKTKNENGTETDTISVSDSDSETEQSFMTTEESHMERLENLSSQQLEIIGRTESKINKCINKLNFVFLLNAIGWLLLFIVDPVRVDIVQKMECY